MALIVNGEYVGDAVLMEEERRVAGEHPVPQHEDLLRHEALRRVVNRVLLRQMAIQSQVLVSDDEVEAERKRRWNRSGNSVCGAGVIEGIRNDLQMDHFCAGLTKHVLRPSRMEVEKFYRAHLENFYEPERVQVAHIVKNVERPEEEESARSTMIAAEKELISGHPFAKVANTHSDCAGGGGALGWVARGEMVDAFDDVVFALKKGERSPIFRTEFGFHIATVTGKKPAGVKPLEDVRLSLAHSLWEGRKQMTIEQAIVEIARRSRIEEVQE